MSRWFLIVVSVGLGCAGRQTPEGSQEVVVSPIPVPQPVYPREALSHDLQELWKRVEEAVAVRPPEPPKTGSTEAIHEWAEGEFRDWLLARQAATDRALSATQALRTNPLFERGMGTALFVNPRSPLRVGRGLAKWVHRQGCAAVSDLVGKAEM